MDVLHAQGGIDGRRTINPRKGSEETCPVEARPDRSLVAKGAEKRRRSRLKFVELGLEFLSVSRYTDIGRLAPCGSVF